MRLPRDFHSVPVTWKSSGQGLSPTPKPKRLLVSTATELTDLATSTGCRMGSLTTKVVKRRRPVTAPIAGTRENGSMNGRSSRKCRSPSGVYGYLLSDTSG
jgi:hypothetical protein